MHAKLPRRVLGSTGLEVSVLGFGASPLGSVFEEINEADGIAAVHEAFRLGINVFDTSPFYGATKSETVLGKALKDLPREQIVVCTKVGRYGPELFDFSAERITASVAESLARLQTPYIDLLQCHDIEFAPLDQIVNETLPALARLKERGLVRFVGITGLPLGVFPYVLDRAPPGAVDVVLSYCHYSLNDTSLAGLVPYLRAKGLGVISASPLSMGLLTKQGPPSWHPAPPEVKAACAAAASHCAAQGVDISSLALKFALRNPDIATTLVGMASVEVVRANVESALAALGAGGGDAAGGTSEAAGAELRALAEVERILAPARDVTWPSGRPENSGLPF
ncbi:L-galactose dehydrogenase [Raphidocelis subcapitata]|uniref:L-galactose dehydrogenase n=1 Tax=Raphidocelis subcapitata TaxID=307507 RepID=A0A2V0PL54_9CHLO|nr:L-galactose dehydrogenase [Raphidocelis subcapitata]|eukprot:GBG00535.1 L-galactose dehydrogenase [Raphidocelis subcapitata]